VPNRSRFASRLTLWAFAAALALKSAVPMLAAVAAGLQGRAVAEICDVYGVATAALGGNGAPAPAAPALAHIGHELAHAHLHGHGDAHGHGHDDAHAAQPHVHVDAAIAAAAHAPDDAPAPDHRHGGKAGDHCALTGLVAIAAIDPPLLPGLLGDDAPRIVVSPDRGTIRDAAARWAALLGHGPPPFS
jgi:hypothetical protein